MPIPYETPLHFALVWLATRDPESLHALMRNSEVDIREVLARSAPSVDFDQICSDSQLKLLFEGLADKGFGIRGTPIEKGQHISAVGLFDPPYDMEREALPHGLAMRIETEIADKLRVEATKSEIRLLPRDWLFNGGWVWRDVEVFWPEVLEAFPETTRVGLISQNIEPCPAPPDSTQNAADQILISAFYDLIPSSRNVLLAFLEASKDRKYLFSRTGDRDNAIRAVHPGEPTHPSDSTISRAFREFSKRTGVDLTDNERAR